MSLEQTPPPTPEDHNDSRVAPKPTPGAPSPAPSGAGAIVRAANGGPLADAPAGMVAGPGAMNDGPDYSNRGGPLADAPGGMVARPAATHGESNCANCGAPLTGKFCSNCGQRREHEIHSIWHFTQEATEDLTHADSRLWSTMSALMFKPGLLTCEFLAGRRVKYLPPLRLYLVLSVVFFLILSSGGDHGSRAITVRTSGGKPSVSVINPDEANILAPRPGETPEQRVDRVCHPEYDGPLRRFVLPFLEKGCRKSILDNGHTIGEATMHNLPRAMFIFVPALAVVMKLMYWRPRRYYVEHLLFFVHTHAFIFALFGLYTLLLRLVPAALDDWIQLVVWGYTAYYLFVSMRRVYGQGRFITFLKYTALSFTYLIGAALTLALTVTYSVYAL